MTSTTAWLLLFAAGLLEIGWGLGLRFTYGFTRPLPSLVTAASAALSFIILSQVVRVLPTGTAYAIWAGMGTAGIGLLGVLLFGESAAPARVLFLLLIVVGIVGLRLFSR